MGDVNMRNCVKFVEDNAGIKRHQKMSMFIIGEEG